MGHQNKVGIKIKELFLGVICLFITVLVSGLDQENTFAAFTG